MPQVWRMTLKGLKKTFGKGNKAKYIGLHAHFEFN